MSLGRSRLDWLHYFHSSLLFYFSVAGVSLMTYLLMKGELTPEEINSNSIGMFQAGVETVNMPIITEFIIINLKIIKKLLRPRPRVSRYFLKWRFVFRPHVFSSSGQINATLSRTSLHDRDNRVDSHSIKLHYDHSSTQKAYIARGVLPILFYTGRLRPKGIPFPGFRYKKGWGFYLLKYMNGLIYLFVYLFIYLFFRHLTQCCGFFMIWPIIPRYRRGCMKKSSLLLVPTVISPLRVLQNYSTLKLV